MSDEITPEKIKTILSDIVKNNPYPIQKVGENHLAINDGETFAVVPSDVFDEAMKRNAKRFKEGKL